LLTFLTIFLTGAHALELDGAYPWEWNLWAGLKVATALMAILVSHEMGHYLACRYYGVDATLPFLLPAPVINPLVGTFGAVIRIRSPFPNRRALFDIGIAGPLAGFVVCLPVLLLAVREAHMVPTTGIADGTFSLGEPLLFQWAFAWLKPVPDGMTLLIGPFGTAAWFGLFMTGLNLIPLGQLDGGHVTYALLRRWALPIAHVMWWSFIAMIVLVGPHWIVWATLVRLLGLRHPRTVDDHTPPGAARIAIGLLGLAIFVVCFLPDPMPLHYSTLDLLRDLAGWLRQHLT
jgi:membrane-associated protease RseP (regulator of RpoE activity)